MQEGAGPMADTYFKQLAAEAAGLPAELSERLRGDSLVALNEDARDFAEALGLSNQSPTSNLEALRRMAREKPADFNRLADEGKLSLDPDRPGVIADPAEPEPDYA